jgi:hypothetical protein
MDVTCVCNWCICVTDDGQLATPLPVSLLSIVVHIRSRVGPALGGLIVAAAVQGLGDAAQGCAEGILAAGMLEVRRHLRPLVQELISAAPQILCGAHPARVDVGLGHESATQKRGDLVGIDAVVLGFAAVHGPHVKRMAQDAGNPLLHAEIGQPVPGEHALAADHDIRAERLQRLEKCLGISADVFVDAHLALGIEDTEVHPVPVSVDATVKRVLHRVEVHQVSSLLRGTRRHLQDTG